MRMNELLNENPIIAAVKDFDSHSRGIRIKYKYNIYIIWRYIYHSK